ncbi:putative deoxycytidylate deaminase [Lasiosphaeris hirsuta]|uniref:Deoxycytidylate deaminase n=1 Tax=Lasiosphaeris hirsuta TaxID=260670 RepID=A0AA40AR99_9PEZI|nr:putative deoxycytidylate deaminase [Lasiosphaeris hirsuta]
MFIGICGNIFAGRNGVADYLVNQHDFTRLYLRTTSSTTQPAANGHQTRLSLTQDKIPAHHIFDSASDLLDFVTKNWRLNWVTTEIPSEPDLDLYSRRPFFLLISVDAPLTVRFARHLAAQRHRAPSAASTSLASFAIQSDAFLYHPQTGQLPLMSRASIRLVNLAASLPAFHRALTTLDLLNPSRLRPTWDAYFMSLASLAAQRSNCMKRRVGCVVVRDHRVVSTGYNGTPRGLINCGEGGCARCNAGEGAGQGLATCLCIHAEENALLEAGRERLRDGAVLYCDTCPCLTCSIKIVQVGIEEVVYSQGYSMDGDTAAVFREGGVRLRQYVPPVNGLIQIEDDMLGDKTRERHTA